MRVVTRSASPNREYMFLLVWFVRRACYCLGRPRKGCFDLFPARRFINARRRILQPMLDSSCSETPKTKKKTAQNRPVQRFWPDSIASGAAQPAASELTVSEGGDRARACALAASGRPLSWGLGVCEAVNQGQAVVFLHLTLREHWSGRLLGVQVCPGEPGPRPVPRGPSRLFLSLLLRCREWTCRALTAWRFTLYVPAALIQLFFFPLTCVPSLWAALSVFS